MFIFREEDPIFTIYSPLKKNERLSTSKKILKIPSIIQRRRSRRPKKEINTVDVPKVEPPKQEIHVDPVTSVTPVDPLTVNCTMTSTGHVQQSQSMSPAGSGARPAPLLNPADFLFRPPSLPIMNGTSQIPFMQQFLHLNALLLATNLQQMSGQLMNSACEKCRIRRDPNCQCARTLPQGLGGPLLGLPPFLPFLPQPGLLDQFRMGMPPFSPLWPPTSQGMYPHPPTSSSTSSSPSSKVQTVLNDHCYLNKAQMQKLSPQSNTACAPVSPILSPKRDKVKQAMSSCNEKFNLRSKVVESPPPPPKSSFVKQDKIYSSSVRFSLESPSPTELDTPRLDLSDPGIQTLNRREKPEEPESDDKSKIAVIAKDNLTLGRSVSEQILSNIDEEDITTNVTRKRKIVRSTSVPGWFGKGLNLKKKRRF